MAVTLTPQELAVHLRIIISDTQPIPGPYIVEVVDGLAAATELVESSAPLAPLAPTDSQNEAVARIVGYWERSPVAPPQRFGYSAWLHSGAAQLLARFIERRAQAI